MDRIILANTALFKVKDSIELGNAMVPTVRGPLSNVNLVSTNGYRYKDTFWKKVINHESIQDRIASRDMLGMIEHPVDDDEYLRTPYKKASHVVFGVSIEKNIPYGVFGLLNNAEGNSMKALCDVGVPIGVSTRGLGEFIKDNVSDYVDENNYVCITWDFTNNPNLKNAIMTKVTDSMRSTPRFTELLEMYHLRDSGNATRLEVLCSDMDRLVAEIRKEIINK